MGTARRPTLHVYAGWSFALMLILILGLSTPYVQRPQLVLAAYMASYDWRTWTEELCDAPLVPYTAVDVVTLERHVRQARETGIDGFVVEWWGPVTTDNPTEGVLISLLEISPATEFHISALLDLRRPGFESPEVVGEALAALQSRHMLHDAYLRVGGRPVVFLRGTSRIPSSAWEALRNRLDPYRARIWLADTLSQDSLRVFDEVFLFGVSVSEELTETLQSTGAAIRQWRIDHGGWRYWVAPVMPGCDECHDVQCPPGVLTGRLNGQVYESQWAAAVSSTPDWVLIRSFNEWACCTQIEPGLTYGTLYLDLTRQMIGRYVRPPVRPSTATPGPSPLVTPSLQASPTLDRTALPMLSPLVPSDAAPTPEKVMHSVLLTPTRFLLPTPTPTPTSGRMPLSQSEMAPERPIDTVPPASLQAPPTSTPLPGYAPVEGAKASRCLRLPLALAALMVWLRRGTGRSRMRGLWP